MGMSGSRQESAYTSISRCRSGLANTPPWQTDHYPQVVRWTQASGTTGGKGEVPSQGSRPISSLFSCRQLPFCYGAGQQDSSEYLGKGGVAATSSKWYRSFGGAAGVVGSTSDNRWLEPTTPSAPAKEASRLFLNGRSHPSFAKEGSLPPVVSTDLWDNAQLFQGGEFACRLIACFKCVSEL